MAINKNFVVKHGLEVNDKLILADADTGSVGIATTVASYTLHVNGGIGATDLKVGVATVSKLVLTGTVSASSSVGSTGQYLKSTGTGVAWEDFPVGRTSATFTASPGQTTFSFTYSVGLIDVFINGVKLTPSEFTATDAVSIILSNACFGGEIVDIHAYSVRGLGVGATGITGLTIQDEGTLIGNPQGITSINFVGVGLTASATGAAVTVSLLDQWNTTTVGIHTLKNVGIGTTNPRFSLEVGPVGYADTALWVNGNARITGILTVGTSSIILDGSTNTLTVPNLVVTNSTSGVTAAGVAITIRDGGGNLGSASIIDFGDNLSVNLSSGIATITGSAAGGTSSQWVTTAAGIHTLSNVGIGTTNPTSALTVKGNTSLETLNVSGIATFAGSNVKINSGNSLDFGTGAGDLHIYRQSGGGSDSIIKYDGSFSFKVLSDITALDSSDGSITWGVFGNNGVDLYYNNSKKFQTLGAGVTVTGTTFSNQLSVSGVSTFNGHAFTNDLFVGDYDRIFFGDNANLTIGHDTGNSQSLIKNQTADPLVIDLGSNNNSTLTIKNNSTVLSYFSRNNVELYHLNSKKLETIGAGVTVTGTTFSNQLSVSGVSTIGIVTGATYYGDASNAVDGSWTLGANGNSDYTFTGIGFTQTTNDPTLYLTRGRVYEFVNNSGGSHPFQIRLSNGGSAYNEGVTNNGSASGTIRFEVPFNAPNTLYYQCTNHSGMGGVIYILDLPQFVNTNAGIHTLSNVGIGTTNPTSALTVKGNTSLENLSVSGVSTFVGSVNFGSALGIGTNSTESLIQSTSSSQFLIRNSVGLINIRSNEINLISDPVGSPEYLLRGFGNGAVELYYDNSKKFETLGAGVTVTGTTFTDQLSVSGVSTFSGNDIDFTHNGSTRAYWDSSAGALEFKDGDGVVFGTGEDARIAWDGTDWVFSKSTSAGSIKFLKSTGNENIAVFSNDGSVELYHDNSKKFETIGAGVTITGTTFTDQLNVSGVSTFNGSNNYFNGSIICSTYAGTSRTILTGGTGGNTNFYNGGTSYSDFIFTAFQGGSSREIARINKNGVLSLPYADGGLNVVGVSTFVGNVGIGTTNLLSGYNLTVGSSSGIRTDSLKVYGYGNINGLTIKGNSSGYVDNVVISQHPATSFEGGRNVAIGDYSFTTPGAAGDSVAIGYYALNVVGNNDSFNDYGGNVGVGAFAGQSITTTLRSTFIGYGAGRYVTTGSENTILGAYDGNSNGLDIRTSSNNVVLSDGAGNIRFYANSSGNVGLGTTNPTSKLTVRGGDISVGVSTAHGVILTSPNGTQYRLIVANDGTLSTTAV